jgi:predicted HAD superfamily Cof-like phosphohydrolase
MATYNDSIFDDQKQFMLASGQTAGKLNYDQLILYAKLIYEEGATEFPEAMQQYHGSRSSVDLAEVIDAVIDTIVVCVGALHSIGIDPQAAWDAVHKTNLAKIDPETGKVRKREDGKVLKPEGWKSPTKALLRLAEGVK